MDNQMTPAEALNKRQAAVMEEDQSRVAKARDEQRRADEERAALERTRDEARQQDTKRDDDKKYFDKQDQEKKDDLNKSLDKKRDDEKREQDTKSRDQNAGKQAPEKRQDRNAAEVQVQSQAQAQSVSSGGAEKTADAETVGAEKSPSMPKEPKAYGVSGNAYVELGLNGPVDKQYSKSANSQDKPANVQGTQSGVVGNPYGLPATGAPYFQDRAVLTQGQGAAEKAAAAEANTAPGAKPAAAEQSAEEPSKAASATYDRLAQRNAKNVETNVAAGKTTPSQLDKAAGSKVEQRLEKRTAEREKAAEVSQTQAHKKEKSLGVQQ